MEIEHPRSTGSAPLPSGDEKHDAVDADSGVNGVEEGKSAYHPGGFHSVYISDVYGGKYQVVNKIRYGRYSTVWLVKDTSES